MRGDQIPVDFVAEQRVDMLVARGSVGTIEHRVAETAHARHQRDAEQAAEAEHRLALALGVGMQRVRLEANSFFSSPSRMWTASQTPQGMKVVNSAM